MKSPGSCGKPVSRQIVKAHAVIFIALPLRWMVAQSGTTKLATSSLTPFFSVCFNVTGIVAADELVPNAVR